jgi:hypothetical protein
MGISKCSELILAILFPAMETRVKCNILALHHGSFLISKQNIKNLFSPSLLLPILCFATFPSFNGLYYCFLFFHFHQPKCGLLVTNTLLYRVNCVCILFSAIHCTYSMSDWAPRGFPHMCAFLVSSKEARRFVKYKSYTSSWWCR